MMDEKWLDGQVGVIGSMLLDSRTIPIVMAQTSADDFYGPYRTTYEVIRDMFTAGDIGKNADVIAIAERCQDIPEHRKFLVQCMEVTPTAANVESYIRICRRQAAISRIHDTAEQIQQTQDLESIRELLSDATAAAMDRRGSQVSNMAECLKAFYQRQNGGVNYLPWPIEALDEHLFISPGDLVVLGAEPSTGKTAFALQCGNFWAKSKKVGFFSLETSREDLFDRTMAGCLGIDMKKILNNRMSARDWNQVAGLSVYLCNLKIDFIDAAGMTTSDIRARTLIGGYEIIIIDYLQLIAGQGATREAEVSRISRELKTLGRSLGVTILALSQLSRSKDGQHPTMARLRESGQIEADADLILLLSIEDTARGSRRLQIAKNKRGTRVYTTLEFDGGRQLFYKSARSQREAPPPEDLLPLPEQTEIPFEEEE